MLKLDPRWLVLARCWCNQVSSEYHLSLPLYIKAFYITWKQLNHRENSQFPSCLVELQFQVALRLFSVATQCNFIKCIKANLYSGMSSLRLTSCFLAQTNAEMCANLSRVLAGVSERTANNDYPLGAQPRYWPKSLPPLVHKMVTTPTSQERLQLGTAKCVA